MPDYRHALEFGVFITPSNERPDAVVELAVFAERAGLDLVTFQDHPYQRRFLDAWTLLAFVAARTDRVRLTGNVLSLPLRPPAVLARAVASLDLLSGGRVELALGAGAFWDAIAAMGAPRRTPGESVDALAEAIDVIRALWDTSEPRGATFDGRHYALAGAARGPAPAHDVGIWLGAYKPRMLALTGRKADGWLPSLSYLEPGSLAAGNAAIDAAAEEAGRDPAAIRRLLNVGGAFAARAGAGPLEGPVPQWVEALTAFALDDGVSGFILQADDPATIATFADEVAPAVREAVAGARAGGAAAAAADGAASGSPGAPAAAEGDDEYDRLGVTPTADDGTRLTGPLPWDEPSRPRRPRSGPEVDYTPRGRAVGRHLIDVHDMLRTELTELRDIVAQVRDGALGAGDARSALNAMAMRQNDWTLGAFCARYCTVVAQHHGLEDDAVFPHLARADSALRPVIDRLTEEHHVIHDAIEEVDRALVDHLEHPRDFTRLQHAIDFLTDSLLSHLAYEEQELVEPLARVGFYPDQV
jgi:hypothetical protein